MTLSTGPRDLMQALLEGIAFRVAEAAGSVAAMQPLTRISVDGGLARNPYLIRTLANALGRSLYLPDEVEQTALGTSLLAAEAAGLQVIPARSGRTVAPDDPASTRLARFGEIRADLTRVGHR